MKPDGVEDILKWLEEKCKEAKWNAQEAEDNYESIKRTCHYEDEQGLIDSAQMDVERAETRLATLVEIKIGVEKYMKKLRHNGQ